MPVVLVVDDSPVDRRVVGGLLGKSLNLQIEYASDGEEALRVMERVTPNVVVTDLIMPNMDGLELVAAVVERYPLVPVILMTGKGSEEIAVKALKAGAASYVPKSVLPNLLLDTVENVLAMAHEEQTQVRLLDCMTGCSFTLDNDASMIPALVNYLRRLIRKTGLCDETNGIRTCVALEEALNNALYHGNLELDSVAREGDRAAYRALVEERRRQRAVSQPPVACECQGHADVRLFRHPGRRKRIRPQPTARSDRSGESGKVERPRAALDANVYGPGKL